MADELPRWRRVYGALEGRGLRAILHTEWLANFVAAPRRAEIDGRTLASDMAALLRLDDIAHRSDLRGLSPERARARVAGEVIVVDAPPPKGVDDLDVEFQGPEAPIRLRIYTPQGLLSPSAGVVYFHGGGWVTGSVRTHDSLCRRIAQRARCRVVSVEYRLAPEHRFPAAVIDAVAAFRWVTRSSADLGLDPTRIGVAGDSAGGNLSAVVAAHTHEDV